MRFPFPFPQIPLLLVEPASPCHLPPPHRSIQASRKDSILRRKRWKHTLHHCPRGLGRPHSIGRHVRGKRSEERMARGSDTHPGRPSLWSLGGKTCLPLCHLCKGGGPTPCPLPPPLLNPPGGRTSVPRRTRRRARHSSSFVTRACTRWRKMKYGT
jgi:hypothetical protein